MENFLSAKAACQIQTLSHLPTAKSKYKYKSVQSESKNRLRSKSGLELSTTGLVKALLVSLKQ